MPLCRKKGYEIRVTDPKKASDRPTRRELLKRVGAAAGVLAGSAVVGRAVWDKGGFAALQEAGRWELRASLSLARL